jgi:hypothetical protein
MSDKESNLPIGGKRQSGVPLAPCQNEADISANSPGVAADSSESSAITRRSILGTPFPKGVSGNPGGKNPERERLRRLLTERGQDALDGILALARGAKSEKVRLDALIWMAEQVVGKATPMVMDADGNRMRVGIVILPAERTGEGGDGE